MLRLREASVLRPRPLAGAILPALLLLGAAGCSGPGPVAPDLAGSYLLSAVGGEPLPATLSAHPGGLLELVHTELVLGPGGRFRELREYRRTDDGGVRAESRVLRGRHRVIGGALELRSDDGLYEQTLRIVGGGATLRTLYGRHDPGTAELWISEYRRE